MADVAHINHSLRRHGHHNRSEDEIHNIAQDTVRNSSDTHDLAMADVALDATCHTREPAEAAHTSDPVREVPMFYDMADCWLDGSTWYDDEFFLTSECQKEVEAAPVGSSGKAFMFNRIGPCFIPGKLHHHAKCNWAPPQTTPGRRRGTPVPSPAPTE